MTVGLDCVFVWGTMELVRGPERENRVADVFDGVGRVLAVAELMDMVDGFKRWSREGSCADELSLASCTLA